VIAALQYGAVYFLTRSLSPIKDNTQIATLFYISTIAGIIPLHFFSGIGVHQADIIPVALIVGYSHTQSLLEISIALQMMTLICLLAILTLVTIIFMARRYFNPQS